MVVLHDRQEVADASNWWIPETRRRGWANGQVHARHSERTYVEPDGREMASICWDTSENSAVRHPMPAREGERHLGL